MYLSRNNKFSADHDLALRIQDSMRAIDELVKAANVKATTEWCNKCSCWHVTSKP